MIAILRYTVIKTPLIDIFLYADRHRIVHISDRHIFPTTALFTASSPQFNNTKDRIERYLNGKTNYIPFTLPDDMPSFPKRVYTAVHSIPYGKTVTVSQLRDHLRLCDIRALEEMCKSNPFKIVIPCHRILLSHNDRYTACNRIDTDEILRKLEKRCIDKARERR